MPLTSAVAESVVKLADAVRISAVVPSAVLVTGGAALSTAGDEGSWRRFLDAAAQRFESPRQTVLTVLGVLVLAAVLQPAQLAVVRFLTGRPMRSDELCAPQQLVSYAHRSMAATFLIRHHQRRWARTVLRARRGVCIGYTPWPRGLGWLAAVPLPGLGDLRARSAQRRLVHYAAPEHGSGPVDIRPSILGNRLVAVELRAGDPYGFDAHRLAPLLRASCDEDPLRSAESLIEGYLGLSLACVALAVPSALLALRPNGQDLVWVALGALAVALLLYRCACWSTGLYGEALGTVIHLHRFDLLAQLRFPLPRTVPEERAVWSEVARRLSGVKDNEPRPVLPYRHGPANGQPEAVRRPGSWSQR